MQSPDTTESFYDIAIIGMAGRFPGARTLEEFWHNLCEGKESITFFSDEELLAAGTEPALLRNPRYVKARGCLPDIDLFDPAFFDFNPREAEIMDPQHRIFLECAWEALEVAGYDPERYRGAIGVYAGANVNTYLLTNLYSNQHLLQTVGVQHLRLANRQDNLATRVSYKLHLRGPSIVVQTGGSTSLVALHVACQGLLNRECDMTLAGGVSIHTPQKSGYLYREEGITSPDGHCRAFDARSQGTSYGDGVGIVVLKRLADALNDRDTIAAVIKGSAINHNGSDPAIDGQAKVIADALTMAGAAPETISYVEAHGIGTTLGDSIEIAALTQAFRSPAHLGHFCALGSVKTNIGHLDTAAGIAGLLKTVLALQHRRLPASLHFERPNQALELSKSPFYINQHLQPWDPPVGIRRAGVSSFGAGGTNAHLVMQEAPPPVSEFSGRSCPWHLLLLSARTAAALEQTTGRLTEHLQEHPELPPASVAYTLQVGRKAFSHRRMVVCSDLQDATHVLNTNQGQRIFTAAADKWSCSTIFMFPGQGAQYVNMGRELYQTLPIFREHIDLCADLLKPHVNSDLRTILYGENEEVELATAQLAQTAITQPALFAVEYAMAKTWLALGIRPQAMIGHSIGEYVAACLAGVFSLEDALFLVAARGQLMQQMPPGMMLAIQLPLQEVQKLLNEHISLAASNSPSMSTLSGPQEEVEALCSELTRRGVEARRLHTSHAFHSQMMDPMLRPFGERFHAIGLHSPQIPFISNVTGTWITSQQACTPDYWMQHLRLPVLFSEGLQTLLQLSEPLLLEVGPGHTLSSLFHQQPLASRTAAPRVFASMRHPSASVSDLAFFLTTAGRLWLAGLELEWPVLHQHAAPRRLPLPTYPFERQSFWIEPTGSLSATTNNVDRFPNGASEVEDQRIVEASSRPSHERPQLQSAYVAPRNEAERIIAGIWYELLGIEQIGIYDNFFELGGHSLLATQLLARLREAFQVDVPLKSIFEEPTIAMLSLLIMQGQDSLASDSLLEDILAEIENLSDREVQELLTQENSLHEQLP